MADDTPKEPIGPAPQPQLEEYRKRPVRWLASQRRFVEEYLVDMNGEAAAVRAGYAPAFAAEAAYRMLGEPHIKDAVTRALEVRRARNELTAEKVLRELSLIAFADVTRIKVAEDGRPLFPLDYPEIRRVVSSIKIKQEKNAAGHKVTTTELKFWNKNDALKALAKHLGLLETKQEANQLPGVLILQGVNPQVALGQIAAAADKPKLEDHSEE